MESKHFECFSVWYHQNHHTMRMSGYLWKFGLGISLAVTMIFG